MIHEAAPPRIEEILRLLEAHSLRYVICGSVAARLHGVELVPGDLDIVPDTEPENLAKLVRVLEALEARPPGPFGKWESLSNGEWKWIARETSQEEVLAWRPDPDDIHSFDNLYRTRLGDFDVLPFISGTYADLAERAVRLSAFGLELRVAHVDDLLARLTQPRREKDAPKIARLREIQRGI